MNFKNRNRFYGKCYINMAMKDIVKWERNTILNWWWRKSYEEKGIFNYLIRQQVSKICHEFLPSLSGKKYWKEKEINCKVI